MDLGWFHDGKGGDFVGEGGGGGWRWRFPLRRHGVGNGEEEEVREGREGARERGWAMA